MSEADALLHGNLAARNKRRCKLRGSVSAAIALAACAMVTTTPADARASGTVVIAASPIEADVGDRVEILLRTFLPFSASSVRLDVPEPTSAGYPVESGYWSVLYPWPDYPFRVLATGPAGETTIEMTRDTSDITLFRGAFRPDTAGEWTIRVTNFEPSVPGVETTVMIDDARAPLATPPKRDQEAERPVTQAVWFTAVVFLAGISSGLLIGIAGRARSARAKR